MAHTSGIRLEVESKQKSTSRPSSLQQMLDFSIFFRRGTFQFGRGRSTLIVKEGNRFLFSMKGTFSVKEDLRYLSNWRGGKASLWRGVFINWRQGKVFFFNCGIGEEKFLFGKDHISYLSFFFTGKKLS